jgi:hypothetical protein
VCAQVVYSKEDDIFACSDDAHVGVDRFSWGSLLPCVQSWAKIGASHLRVLEALSSLYVQPNRSNIPRTVRSTLASNETHETCLVVWLLAVSCLSNCSITNLVISVQLGATKDLGH